MEEETLSFIEEKDKSKILNDWWLSLIFFFDRVFYQGRSDELSGRFERAAIKALTELLGETTQQKLDKLLSLKERECLDYKKYQECKDLKEKLLTKKYPISQPDGKLKDTSTGKERDREMIVSTLKFIAQDLKENDYSILKHSIQKIEKHKMQELHNELTKIRQIGDKTASFFLRDVVAVFNLTKELEESDYVFLQPVDTWVRQISKKLKLVPDNGCSDERLKEIIVKTCLDNGSSPIKFNQGIWYLGARSLDVIFKWFLND